MKITQLLLVISLVFGAYVTHVFGQKTKTTKKKSVDQPGLQLQEVVSLSETGDPSLDLAIQELYGVISGPAGQKRDWEKFRAMFAPNAQMGITVLNKDGVAGFKRITPEEYISSSGPYLEEKGFFETELSRKVERYGQLVHVWSTYEARNKEAETKPIMRGINSIQLVKIGDRYKVASLIWQSETKENQLPAGYLPQQKK